MEKEQEQFSSKKTLKNYRISLLAIATSVTFMLSVFGLIVYQQTTIDPFDKKGSTLAQDYFLESAKTYFEYDSRLLPKSTGTCRSVNLKTIQEEELIYNIKFYNKCDNSASFVKACKLESGNYHFEVSLTCNSKVTKVAYGEEKKLMNDENIISQNNTKINFKYQALKLDTTNSYFGEKKTAWKDEITEVNYKILEETTYYRYRDKLFRWDTDVRYYYPQDKNVTELVQEYYKESPKDGYIFKETSQNKAYKWYIETDSGNKYYYPSGSTNVNDEKTYYLIAPVSKAKKDISTETFASKYYRVEKTKISDYLPVSSSINGTRILETQTWSKWSDYSTIIPNYNLYGKNNREVETRVKVEYIPISTKENTEVVWNKITNDYVEETVLIKELKKLGYQINDISDINNIKEVKYKISQTYQETK